MLRFLVALSFLFCVTFGAPIVTPVVMYSGLTTVAIGSVDVYYFDLTCFVNVSGALTMNVDQPDFDNIATGAYMFVSNGPSTGQYAPYPDPMDNTTFQWSTLNGTGSPLPGIVISDAGGLILYVTIDCPNSEQCVYTMVTEYDPGSSKTYKENYATTQQSSEYPWPSKNVKSFTQKQLFFSNQMQVDQVVNYNQNLQFQLLICNSQLVAIFGKGTKVCLKFTVVGEGAEFAFYQFVANVPSTGQNTPKWQTRKPDPNPYLDFSGRGKLFINTWISLPTQVQSIPLYLYQNIFGFGGNGLSPPFPNPFSAYYEISSNCP